MKFLNLEEAKSLGKDKIRSEWNRLYSKSEMLNKKCDIEFEKRSKGKNGQMTKTQYDKLQNEATVLDRNLSMMRTAMISLGGEWLEVV